MVARTLATYLPSPDHPQYAAYEEGYENYKKSLEQRYPQICANCFPRAQARLRTAAYAAKTDHLRRLMERNRHGPSVASYRRTWRDIVVVLGGAAWWLAVFLQVLWSALGAQLQHQEAALGGDDSASHPPSTCLTEAFSFRRPSFECWVLLQQVVVALTAASFWWNNKLLDKFHGPRGRMTGLGQNLQIQFIVFTARLVALFYLQDPSTLGLEPQPFRAVHGFIVMFTLIV